MLLGKPKYYDDFRCIASACPDSCCQEWEVAVDPESAARYRSLPGPLGDRLRQVLYEEDHATYMAIQDRRCPMWRADGLCRIQAELGEEALCHTCRTFPRLRHDYGAVAELQLELSCPEAARLILQAPAEDFLRQELPDEGVSDCDEEALALLLDSRRTALSLLAQGAPGQALARFLLYACQVQGELDGGEALLFEPETALETAKFLAKPWEPGQMLAFFQTLEILTPQWKNRLEHPEPGIWPQEILALARYLTQRYWLQAVSDYDVYCRAKLVVISCLLVRQLGGDIVGTAQLFSKEIENNTENVEALLDAAYRHRAFTDDKLLGALLG